MHQNGLGGTFSDCDPLATYTRASALKAAASWSSVGTLYENGNGFLCGSPACIAWKTSSGACGVWCWGTSAADPAQGKVGLATSLNACQEACPPNAPTQGTWN